MDNEFKKLLAGESWANEGDRVDMDNASIQPTITRSEGFGEEFSTTTTPSRARVNQILRELSGGAKEVLMGVSEYDDQVSYPAGAMCQLSGDIYYATTANSPSSPVSPNDVGQTTWTIVGGRTVASRTRPVQLTSADDLFIDGSRADQFRLWWDWEDNGGHPVTGNRIIYYTAGATATSIDDYVQGTPVTISTKNSDEFFVQVAVKNILGFSAYSPAKKVATNPVAPDVVPGFIVRESGTSGSVKVNYSAPDSRGLNIDEYFIQWKSGNQNYSLTQRRQVVTSAYPNLDSSLTISGFDPDTVYTFRVLAKSNRVTYSAPSIEQTVTPSGTIHSPEKPVIATDAIDATTMLAWITDRINTNGADELDQYEWRWRKITNPVSSWTVVDDDGQDESYLLKNAERGESYQFSVRVRNQTGWSQFSDSKSETPYSPPKPDAPIVSIGASDQLVEGFLKGEVKFSMNQMTRPESVKDQIIQTAVRWRETGQSDASWVENSSNTFSGFNTHRFEIPQIFPTTGNIPIGRQLEVEARWRNSGDWSDWSARQTLGAVSVPAGQIILSASGSVTIDEGGTFNLSVRLSRVPVANVVVAISINNSILTSSASSLTFTSDNWNTNQTVTFTAGTDSDNVDDVAVITFAGTGGLTASDQFTVNVKEPIRVSVFPEDISIKTNESQRDPYLYLSVNTNPIVPLNVSLSSPSSNISFYDSHTAVDGEVELTSFTFTVGNWRTTRRVAIRTTNNAVEETTITVTMSGASSHTVTVPVTLTTSGSFTDFIFSTSGIKHILRGESTQSGVLASRNPNGSLVTDIGTTNLGISSSPSSVTFTSSNYNSSYMNLDIQTSSLVNVGARSYIYAEPETSGYHGSGEQSVFTINPFNLGNRSQYPNGSTFEQERQIIRLTENSFVDVPIYIPFQQSDAISFTATSDIDNLEITQYGINEGDSGANNSITVTNRRQGTGQNKGFRIRAPADEDTLSNSGTLTITPSGAFTTPVTFPITIVEPSITVTLNASSINLATGSGTHTVRANFSSPASGSYIISSTNYAINNGIPRVNPQTIGISTFTDFQVLGNNAQVGTYTLEVWIGRVDGYTDASPCSIVTLTVNVL